MMCLASALPYVSLLCALCNSNPVGKQGRRASSLIPETPHVLQLTVVSGAAPRAPYSTYYNRFNYNRAKSVLNDFATNPVSAAQQALLTLAGRVYMTNLTIANRSYVMVIDTGSSDTWLASQDFQCKQEASHVPLEVSRCGFGALYTESDTFELLDGRNFSVAYSDGELLAGSMGVEEVSVAGLKAKQTIGVVEQGWWIGDGRSSGLMGLAFPALVSGAKEGTYRSIMFSLLGNNTVPPIFSLALSQSAGRNDVGGVLALGGIPSIPYDEPFVLTPILPMYPGLWTWYTIAVDGFAITPPNSQSSSSQLRNRQSELEPELDLQSEDPGVELDRAPAAEYATQSKHMIVDSGTTMIYLPDPIVAYIATLFSPPATLASDTGLYMAPCTATAPRFGVIIAGKTLYVSEQDMLNPMGGGQCVLAIQPQGEGKAVLGDAWLKNVLAVFDLGRMECRFAGREDY